MGVLDRVEYGQLQRASTWPRHDQAAMVRGVYGVGVLGRVDYCQLQRASNLPT